MKQTNKLLSILLLSVSLLMATAPAYYADKFLFSLDKDEEVLTAEQCKSLNTPYPELNKIIKKYDVVKIEPWLPNAKPTDHDGDVYLNRIYRLTTNHDVPAPLALISEFKNSSPAIIGTEREAIMRIHAIPDDPQIGNQGYLIKAQVKETWNLWDLEGGEIPGDRRIVVAVVDDGVEYTHPDLWKNIWINQDEIPSVYFSLIDVSPADSFITAEEAVSFLGNGKDLEDLVKSNLICDGTDTDGDGYIDNIIGWDTNLRGYYNDSTYVDDDRNPMPTNNSHGTHVAGLAGARTNNGIGIASAGYNISIMPVKATGDETVDNISTGWAGILCAAQSGADIINCSWGGPGYSYSSQTVINTCYNQYGAIIVAAAGNGDNNGNPSDEPHYPSGYKNVVSVTAVSSADIFSWANYGAADLANFAGVDISAPGENMYSTYLTKDGSYKYLNGTSMASPFVASCFALLKSVYPDSTNGWLVDRMLSHTDPIDHLNPGYEGQLGTGRVNILKTLIFDKWPKLSYADQNESILNDDGDSILNPGETINLIIELKNDTGWTTASNVQGVLRSSNEGITIPDSIGTWTSIPENTFSSNTDNGFTIQFSTTLAPANYDFELVLVANDSGELPYEKTILLDVSLSLDQKGFPFYASTAVEASPLFVDIDGDGKQEIIFGDKSGELYVVDHTGDTLDGFPITLGSQLGGIAVADIDLDDTLEIVATSFFNKKIEVVDVMGNREWTQHTNLFITAMPAIGNIDNDPELEVVVGSYDQNIYAFNHDSTDVTAFPHATGQLLHGGVSLADVNADGLDDIVYGDKGGQCSIVLADGTTPIGWPVSTSGSITSEPQIIVTGDHSAIILIGNDNGDMYGFDLDGTQRFMIDGFGSIKASPAIYSCGDNIYAFFATSQGSIYKVDIINNTLENGWPKEISPINQSLVIVDVLDDAEDKPQILAMGNDGYIYAFDMEGNRVQGYPLNTGLLSKSGLAVTDIDDDGDNDLISGNYSGLSVIDLKSFAGTIYWSMHRGSADRRGSITKILTGIDDVNIPEEFELELIGNAPNPFNPTTTISYKINDITPLDLRIYSLDGKLVLNRQIANPEYGMNKININMIGFSSGIYLYSLESRNEIRKAKMIYLK
jgi:hypothetical protein